jgi:hypothetical protein
MSKNQSLASDDRLVLAFYGLKPLASGAQDLFLATSNWINELGYTPDKLGVLGKEFNGKLADYHRMRSKLEKLGFSHVTGFELHASLPNTQIPALEYLASVSYSDGSDDGGYAVVAFPSSVDALSWLPVAKKIIEVMQPAYGIAFRRELRLGPVMFALGICQGAGLTGSAYEEARNISRWCDMGMPKRVYMEGLLRDVYPWNFLTLEQLDRQINDTSLQNWIQRDADRGVLSQINDAVWLWEIEDRRIPAVRRMLWDAGAIFDWRTYGGRKDTYP